MININNDFRSYKTQIEDSIQNFETKGKMLADGRRNKIKTFETNGITLNIKRFKVPHLLNRVVYKWFRKSKARRSYEYAHRLLGLGIGTPKPIAYMEKNSFLLLGDSAYVSEHLQADLTYKELVEIPDYPDHENILRQFTQFCYNLHNKGVEFNDHTPGNTLIVKESPGIYSFYLVDLNRMKFYSQLSFEKRMYNLRRLTPKKDMVAVMANEYAKLSGESEELVYNTLWEFTTGFQYKFFRKKRLKKKLKFWK